VLVSRDVTTDTQATLGNMSEETLERNCVNNKNIWNLEISIRLA